MFQYPEHQLFEIDVFSDVCFGPKNLGLDKKEVELRAYDALKKVGLPDELFYQSPLNCPVDRSVVWRSPEYWQ